MCNSKLYINEANKQKLIRENVAQIRIRGSKLIVESVFEESLQFNARITEIDFLKNRIVIEKSNETD